MRVLFRTLSLIFGEMPTLRRGTATPTRALKREVGDSTYVECDELHEVEGTTRNWRLILGLPELPPKA